MHRNTRVHLGFLGLLAVLAGALVLLVTRRYGINISPDSAFYAAAAEGVARGDGVTGVDGDSLALYAPGLPAVLALFADLAAPSTAARWLNAIMFAAIVLFVGVWLARHVRSWVAIGAAAAVAVSPSLLNVHTWLWSEPLYLVLTLPFFALAVEIATRRLTSRWALVALGFLAAAATLTRYAGGYLVLLAAFIVLTRRGSWRQKITDLAIVAAAFGLPVAAWLARNLQATDTLAGERLPNALSPISVLVDGLQAAAVWVVPKSAPLLVQLLLLAYAGVVALALGRAVWRRRPFAGDRRGVLLAVAAGYMAVGFVATVVLVSRTNVDPIGERLLVVLLVPFVVGVAACVDLAADQLTARAGRVLAAAVAVAFAANALISIPPQLAVADDDVAGTNGPRWQNDATSDLLAAIPEEGTLTSNEPWTLNYLIERPVEESPRLRAYASTATVDDVPEFRTTLGDDPAYLVWLNDVNDFHMPVDQLDDHFVVKELESTASGTLYEIRPN